MNLKNACPCGSEKTFENCCSPLIQGKAFAKTAEDLLRARYTAFTVGAVDFILKTHHSKTVHEVKREEIEEWSKSSEWLGLKVIEKSEGTENDEKATIIFQAQYKVKEKLEDHFEKSFFEKENGQWKFLDAHGLHQGPYVRSEPKLGRNDPCHCGSGKKFKKCHAA
jgi:SEC-C motif domain protein